MIKSSNPFQLDLFEEEGRAAEPMVKRMKTANKKIYKKTGYENSSHLQQQMVNYLPTHTRTFIKKMYTFSTLQTVLELCCPALIEDFLFYALAYNFINSAFAPNAEKALRNYLWKFLPEDSDELDTLMIFLKGIQRIMHSEGLHSLIDVEHYLDYKEKYFLYNFPNTLEQMDRQPDSTEPTDNPILPGSKYNTSTPRD